MLSNKLRELTSSVKKCFFDIMVKIIKIIKMSKNRVKMSKNRVKMSKNRVKIIKTDKNSL